jgi:hypothetical protein
VLSVSALIVRLRQQRRYPVRPFTALDSDCLTLHCPMFCASEKLV